MTIYVVSTRQLPDPRIPPLLNWDWNCTPKLVSKIALRRQCERSLRCLFASAHRYRSDVAAHAVHPHHHLRVQKEASSPRTRAQAPAVDSAPISCGLRRLGSLRHLIFWPDSRIIALWCRWVRTGNKAGQVLNSPTPSLLTVFTYPLVSVSLAHQLYSALLRFALLYFACFALLYFACFALLYFACFALLYFACFALLYFACFAHPRQVLHFD